MESGLDLRLGWGRVWGWEGGWTPRSNLVGVVGMGGAAAKRCASAAAAALPSLSVRFACSAARFALGRVRVGVWVRVRG